ncbi:hypothetical protein [Geoglobus sp.]
MSAESTKRRTFISLLKYAIVEEYYTSRKIFAVLKEYDDEKVWDVLFGILIDIEKHRILLEDIVKLLNMEESTDLEKKDLYAYLAIKLEDLDGILEELLATERYFYRAYTQILEYFENSIEFILDTETAEIIKSKLDEIIDDEIKHIDLISNLL